MSTPERTSDEDPLAVTAAMHVAMQWKDVDPAHLAAALAAMEPALKREHRERILRMNMMREDAQRKHAQELAKRHHVRDLAYLGVGAVVALGMLTAGVLVAPHHWWLSTLLCGPSLLALAKIFVLRRSDDGDMRAVAGAARQSTNAGAPPPPP